MWEDEDVPPGVWGVWGGTGTPGRPPGRPTAVLECGLSIVDCRLPVSLA